jgi:hypothetical protein
MRGAHAGPLTHTQPQLEHRTAPSSAVSPTSSACRLVTSSWTGLCAEQKREGQRLFTVPA